jgi:hypothetical protein
MACKRVNEYTYVINSTFFGLTLASLYSFLQVHANQFGMVINPVKRLFSSVVSFHCGSMYKRISGKQKLYFYRMSFSRVDLKAKTFCKAILFFKVILFVHFLNTSISRTVSFFVWILQVCK